MAATKTRTIQGSLDGGGHRFGIVVARFNEDITLRLLAGARRTFQRHRVADANLLQVWVPGAFELGVAAARMARSGRFSALVCLGAVIRGDTPHFDHVCAGATHAIASVAIETEVPVAFGLLTCDNHAQALERAGENGNKGAEAACAALEMASVLAALPVARRGARRR